MRIKILDVIRELTEKILRMESKVLRWKLLIGNCTNKLDGMPHAKNNSSQVDSLVTRIVDGENKVEELKEIRQVCTIELSDWLEERLEENHMYKVMFLRYGLCKPFKVIAKELGYSERMIFRFHRTALERLKLSVACQ